MFFSCGSDEEIAAGETVVLKSNIEPLLVEKNLDDQVDGLLTITDKIRNLQELHLDVYLDNNTEMLSYLLEDIEHFSSLETLKLEDYNFLKLDLDLDLSTFLTKGKIKDLSLISCKLDYFSFEIVDTKLYSLTLSNCSGIKAIGINNNIELTELDLSLKETRFVSIRENNKLSDASFEFDEALNTLYIADTKLSTIQLDDLYETYHRIVNIFNNTVLESIDMHSCNINTIHLDSNKNLKKLDLHSNRIRKLNLIECEALTELDLSNNWLEAINLNENKNLVELNLSNNRIESIDVTNLENLNKLNLAGNELTQIDLAKKKGLFHLDLSSNYLSDLSLDSMNLYSFDISDNLFSKIRLPKISLTKRSWNKVTLNFSSNINLSSIEYNGSVSNISYLDITNTKLGRLLKYTPNMTSLKILNASNCDANTDMLELRSSELEEINVRDNRIKGLKFRDCKNLKRIEAKNNPIATVDINNSFNLEYFNLPYSNSIWHQELLDICRENNRLNSESEDQLSWEGEKEKEKEKDEGWNWTVILLVIIAIIILSKGNGKA